PFPPACQLNPLLFRKHSQLPESWGQTARRQNGHHGHYGKWSKLTESSHGYFLRTRWRRAGAATLGSKQDVLSICAWSRPRGPHSYPLPTSSGRGGTTKWWVRAT